METHFRISVCIHKSAQKANSNLSLKQKYIIETAPSTGIFCVNICGAFGCCLRIRFWFVVVSDDICVQIRTSISICTYYYTIRGEETICNECISMYKCGLSIVNLICIYTYMHVCECVMCTHILVCFCFICLLFAEFLYCSFSIA